ncbi:MAG: divergent PAP2 family protein, partial [Candidatus Woesearchaeota archaeon]|nr:divergent PAP2 family protein [Candidatus Woesearchaeota archaeon]
MTLEVISEIIFNKIFLTIIITWALGQATKIILDWIYHRRITFSNLVELGGMLSTHATVVAAMTVVIYLDQGVSTLFIIVGIISVIVLRDAVGVRFEVEEHAKLLNKK